MFIPKINLRTQAHRNLSRFRTQAQILGYWSSRLLPFTQVSVVSFLVIKFDSASDSDYPSFTELLTKSNQVTDQTRIFRKLVDEFEYQKKRFWERNHISHKCDD